MCSVLGLLMCWLLGVGAVVVTLNAAAAAVLEVICMYQTPIFHLVRSPLRLARVVLVQSPKVASAAIWTTERQVDLVPIIHPAAVLEETLGLPLPLCAG
jgi:hypothetical protein